MRLKSVVGIVESWNSMWVYPKGYLTNRVNMESFGSMVIELWRHPYRSVLLRTALNGAVRIRVGFIPLCEGWLGTSPIKSNSTVVALNLRSRFYMLSSFEKVVSTVRVNDSLCNSQKILIRTGNSLCWLGCLRTRLLEPSSFPKRWLRARFGCPRTFDRYQLTFGQLPGWSCQ